jgi:hypothetical protein
MMAKQAEQIAKLTEQITALTTPKEPTTEDTIAAKIDELTKKLAGAPAEEAPASDNSAALKEIAALRELIARRPEDKARQEQKDALSAKEKELLERAKAVVMKEYGLKKIEGIDTLAALETLEANLKANKVGLRSIAEKAAKPAAAAPAAPPSPFAGKHQASYSPDISALLKNA